MTPYEFYKTGLYLFEKYLGSDYAEDFMDYFNMISFYGVVETTALYDMLCELRGKIAATCKGKAGLFDYGLICEMMECEEMMKIIRENSIIMDNDD
jgi:hypothetical protein